MSYKERVVTSVGYSRLGTEAEDGVGIQRDIEGGRTVRDDDRSVLIPFHAVDRAVITISTTDKEEKNPYGCEAEGGGSGSKVDSAKVCTDKVGCDGDSGGDTEPDGLIIYMADVSGEYGCFDPEKTGMSLAEVVAYCESHNETFDHAGDQHYRTVGVEVRYSDDSVFSQYGSRPVSKPNDPWTFQDETYENYMQIRSDYASCGSWD